MYLFSGQKISKEVFRVSFWRALQMNNNFHFNFSSLMFVNVYYANYITLAYEEVASYDVIIS